MMLIYTKTKSYRLGRTCSTCAVPIVDRNESGHCRRCYRASAPIRMASCHPEQKHYVRGLCRNCSRAASYAASPERHRAKARAFAAKDPGRVRQRSKEWQARNAAYQQEYYHANRDRVRSRQMMQRHGISLETYNVILSSQGGACAICTQTPERPLHIDHCHATGTVRGLLCGPCNMTMGRVDAAVEYVDRLRAYAHAAQAIRSAAGAPGVAPDVAGATAG